MVNNRDNDSGVDENAALEESAYTPMCNKNNDVEEGAVKRKSDTFYLYFVAVTAIVLLFVASIHHVWASPVIPKLRMNNTDINPIGRPITTIETSILGGLPFLAGLIGSLFVGHVADINGRKKTMIGMAIVMLVSTVVIAFSNNLYVYVVARCVIFIQFSASLVLLPVYLLEICEDHNRAKFGCLMGIGLPAGHLYSYVVGSLTNVKMFTLLCGAPLLPYLLSFSLWAPESPVFLAAAGKTKPTIRVLEKLRHNKSYDEIQKDFQHLQESIHNRANKKKIGITTIFKCPIGRKGLLIATVPVLVQHFSGVSVIMQFMEPIFNKSSTYLSGSAISILAGLVKISCFFSTAMIVEKFGRRRLLIISSSGTGVTLLLLGLYFYWKETTWVHLDKIQWLPIVSLLANLMIYSIGLGPIPMALMSELFPGSTRAVGTSIVMTFSGSTIAVLNFLFPIISESFGIYCCFWFFSFSCFLGSFLIYNLLPDTRGKTIMEIQNILKNS